MAYNMHHLAAMNPNGVSNGASVPPIMMMYPFDNNSTYVSSNDQLDLDSLGPDANEQSQLNDETQMHGSSAHCSSPDQPSSPHHHR